GRGCGRVPSPRGEGQGKGVWSAASGPHPAPLPGGEGTRRSPADQHPMANGQVQPDAPPPPAQAARAFQRLRWWLTRNQVRSLLSGSRLRLAMVVECSAVFWSGLFVLFFEGFQFLGSFVRLSNEVVEYLF